MKARLDFRTQSEANEMILIITKLSFSLLNCELFV